ncbi:MAG: hypothetical protein JO202_12105 [Ktedonobacteraceae bacterium]|nr:hypothetical protein [Ktedonobacteraceae bacterium]
MSDSITQSETKEQVTAAPKVEETQNTRHAQEPSTVIVIWTPRFLVIFALVLVIGLSSASLLTRGWANNFYRGEWVLLAQTAVVFCCWSVVVVLARSPWVRIGSIFGCIWAIFTGMGFVISLLSVAPQSAVVAHLNAATNSALLCSYICLSIARIPFQRWDTWFFRIGPTVGIVAIVVTRICLHPTIHRLQALEGSIAAVALCFCVFVWWLRPSCWRSQPGPTLLFGLAPLLLLLLALFNNADPEANFFFSQVLLLCILLAVLRILQRELRSA